MLEDILSEIPSPTAPTAISSINEQIATPSLQDISIEDGTAKGKDIFHVEQRKAWDKSMEARCDFQYHLRLTRRASTNFDEPSISSS